MGQLDIGHVDKDPIVQFGRWLEDAVNAGIEEPTAMTLATASKDGIPSARIVLLKGYDKDGFVFYTNYTSRKAMEMDDNPKAALVLFWRETERQVRIEGQVEKIPSSLSDEYFASRPEESQVSAIISPQSKSIRDRDYLEKLRQEYLDQHAGKHLRPEYWGGYRLVPAMIEFWQKRPSRLHDRIRYTMSGISWKLERLAP